MESYMRILSAIMTVILTLSFSGLSYCEVILDKPFAPSSNTSRSLRTPQEIIADFQSSVDKIQAEHQTLYSEIENKNKENAFLLRKINDLSVQLLQLDYSISKKSTQTVGENPEKLQVLAQEKDILLKKYNEALSQKLALENEIKRLVNNKQSVDDQRQSGLETVKEALRSAEGQIEEQKTAMETVIREKEAIDQKRLAAIEEKAALQERLNSLQLQMKEAQDNETEKESVHQGPLQQRIRQLSDRLDQMQETLREKDSLISTSKSHTVKAQSDLKKIQKERDDLKEEIRKVTSTYNAAQDGRSGKITRLESELKEKKDEIKRLSDENARVKKGMPTLEAERRTLNAQISDLKDNLRKEQSSFEAKLKNAKAPFTLQVEALQKALDTKNGDLQNKNKEIDALKEKSDALAKQLADVKNDRDSVGALKEKTKNVSQDSGVSQQMVQEQIKSLKVDLAERDSQIKVKSEMVDRLSAEKKEVSSQVEKISNQKENLQKMMQTYKDQLNDGNVKADAKSQEARKVFEDKIALLTNDLESKDNKIKEKESQIEQLTDKQNEISAKLEETGHEKDILQETIATLQDQLKKAKSGNSSLQGDAKQSVQEMVGLKSNLKARTEEIEEIKIKTQKLEKELKEVTSERQRFEDETASLKEKLKEQESLGEGKITEARSSSEETIAKLNSQLADRSRQVSEKENLLSDLGIQKQAVEASLRKTEDERDELKTKIVDLEKSLEIFKSGQSNAAERILKSSQEKRDDLAKSLQDARKSIRERDNSIQDFKTRNTKLDKQVSSALKEKTGTEEDVKKLNDQLRILKEESGQKIANIEADAKTQITQAQKSSADAKQALKIKEDLVATLNNKISDSNLQITRLTDEGTKLRSFTERLNQEKAQLEQELTDARKSSGEKSGGQDNPSAQLQAKIDSLVKDRTGLEVKLDEATKEKDDLKKELESATRQKEEALRRNTDDGSKAQTATIATLNSKNTDLEEKLSSATGRSKTLEMTVEDLQSQLRLLRKNSPAEVAAIQTKLQEKIDALTLDLQKSTEQVNKQEKLAKDLKEKNEQLNTVLDASQKSIAEKDKSIFELTATRGELSTQVYGLGKDRDALDAKVRNMTLQINELQASQSGQITSVKSEATQRTADLAMKLADAVGQIRSSEMLVQQLTEKDKNLEQQLAAAGAAKSQSDEALKKSQLEIEHLRKEYEFDRTKMKEDIFRYGNERDSQIIKVNELQNALKDQEKTAKTSTDDARKQLLDVIETLRGLTKEKDSQLEKAGARNKELEQAKEELAQQLLSAQSKQKESDVKVAQLQGVISGKEAERREAMTSEEKELKAKLDEATVQLSASQTETIELKKSKDSLQKSLETAEAKVTQLQAEAAEKEKSLTAVQTQLSQEIAATKKTSETQAGQLTGELKGLQQTVVELTKTKESLEESLKTKETKISQLEVQAAEKQKDFVTAQSQAKEEIAASRKTLDAQVEQLTGELKDLQQSVVDLTKSKNSLEESLKAKETKITELQADATEKEKSLTAVQSQAKEDVAAAKKMLETQVAQLTGDLKSSQQAVDELTKSKNNLEEAVKSSDAKLAQMTKDMADKVSKLENALKEEQAASKVSVEEARKQLVNEIEPLKTATKEKDSQLQQVITLNKELEQVKKGLNEQLAAAQSKQKENESKIAQLQGAVSIKETQSRDAIASMEKELKGKIDEIAAQLSASQAQAAELKRSKDSLGESLKAKETKIAQLEIETSENEKVLATTRAEAKEEIAAAKKTLEAQVEQLTKKLEGSQETVVGLTKVKEGLEISVKNSDAKLVATAAEISKKDGEIKSLQASSSSAIAVAKKPLEDKIDILVKSLGDAQSELKTKQGTMDGLTTKVSGLEKSLSETSVAKGRFEKEALDTKTVLDKTRKDISIEIEKANKPLLEKNQTLQAALDEKNSKITSLTAEKDRLSGELATVTSDAKKLQQETAVLKQEIENQKRTAEEKIASANQPLLAKVAELQKTLDGKEQLIAQKAEAFTKVSGELATVLKGLAVIREERNNLSASVKPLEAQIKSIPQEIALAKKPVEEENARLKLEVEKVQGMLDVRVKGLEADLDAKNAAYDQMVTGRRDFEKEMARVTQESDKLSQENQRLELKLSKKFQEECGVAMEELQKPWKDKIDDLKSQLDGRDKEIESMKNENGRLNQELSNSAASTK
jgi:chromosome segregation ATPase